MATEQATTDLLAVADELYALSPGEFTASRNQRAKEIRAAGEKDLATRVQQLRKPSLAAWTVNMLVRHGPEEMGQVLDLGVSLREAQANLDGDALRDLTRQRRRLIAAMTGKARRLAAELGEHVSDPVARQIEDTLYAAMVDEQAASAVRSGLLTESLTSTGLGTLDISDAVAHGDALGRSAGGPARRPPAKRAGLDVVPEPEPSEEDLEQARQRARAEARAAVEDARAAADKARKKLDKATRQAENLAALGLQLQARTEELRRELAEIEHRQERLDDDIEEAGEKRDRAEARHREATAAVEEAEASLGELES